MLFKVADRLLAAQQKNQDVKLGTTWDYYFPFNAKNVGVAAPESTGIDSFIAFMRFSYYRPRDINSMIGTMREIVAKKYGTASYVTEQDFNDPSFRDAHADYLLGEIRDQLLFYYSQDEFELFLQFFSHLRGKRQFSYDQFVEAFNGFIEECTRTQNRLPQFFESANVFLQFLFEQNVICFKERGEREGDEPFIRWCFRERTLSNMAPKVRVGVEYEIFYGLSKALNVGRPIKVPERRLGRVIGTIASVDMTRGFGFVRGGTQQNEYYFKIAEYKDPRKHLLRPGSKVSFVTEVKYGKLRATDIQLVR